MLSANDIDDCFDAIGRSPHSEPAMKAKARMHMLAQMQSNELQAARGALDFIARVTGGAEGLPEAKVRKLVSAINEYAKNA